MKRRREKSNSSTLSFIMAALEARKKVNLAITLLKIRLDTYICICIQERDEKKNLRSKEGYTCSHTKETIHLYDKQFHVVWQDIRAPNEKDPDCHMTGT